MWLLGATLLAACGLDLDTGDYGADWDYPDEPSVPTGAVIVADGTAWDDDDPIRGREIVVDIGDATKTDLVRFYRDQFPAADDWVEGSPDADLGGGHLLCLVKQSPQTYDEYLEIYPHKSPDFEYGSHGRYLIAISRVSARHEVSRCGAAFAWYDEL